MQFKIFSGLSAFLFLLTLPVAGQAPVSRIEESVVVTASLEPQEQERVSAAVAVIPHREIEERQATEIMELLATVPGLSVVQSGSAGQVTSLFSRGTESDHTLVLWNGVELNDPYFGGFNWAFLPTDGVERVEVVRGPFSALYGSEAIGGVIQVITSRESGAGLRLEAGGNDYLRGGISGGIALGDLRVDLSGHLRSGHGELENEFYDGATGAAAFEWKPADSVTLSFIARQASADTGIPQSGGVPTPNRTVSWKERELALPVQADFDTWSLEARISQVAYDNEFRDPDDAVGFTYSDTESESLRGRVVATYRGWEDSWVAFGGDVERVEVDDMSVFGVSLAGADQRTESVFAQAYRSWGEVAVDLGLRHDSNSVFGSQTSPKIGVVAAIGERSRIRGVYGEGFRAPSAGELFYPFTGNPDLQPEESRSIEVGLESDIGRWMLSISGYRTDLQELIDFDFASFRNVNVGRARIVGIEAGFGVRASARADLRWHATWLATEDRETGLELLRRPEWSSTLVANWRPERWTLNLVANFVGERPDIDPVSFERAANPAYFRIDLAVKRPIGKRLAPYLRVENATDESYDAALGFPAAGRTLVGGVAISL